jgi:hypothetical protein
VSIVSKRYQKTKVDYREAEARKTPKEWIFSKVLTCRLVREEDEERRIVRKNLKHYIFK